MIRILYFAWLRERMRRAEESLPIPPGVATIGELASWLRQRDEAGAARVCRPRHGAGRDQPKLCPARRQRHGWRRGGVLSPGDRRVSPTVRVQAAVFDLGAEMGALLAGRTDVGGVGSFIGVVRDDPARLLESLTLEHYPGMTEAAMTAIAAQACERWSLLGCTVIHRVGRLTPGEGIVLVLAAAPHRQAALEATAFLIDWLKTRAPFWKHEQFAGGAGRWVAARDTDDEAAARW